MDYANILQYVQLWHLCVPWAWCHVASSLQHLHWLSVQYSIHYKVLLLVFLSLHSMAPPYIFSLLHPYPPLPICSTAHCRLCSVDDRLFSIAGPQLWNVKPQGLCQCTSVASSKVQLQTRLCRPTVLAHPAVMNFFFLLSFFLQLLWVFF